MDAKFAGYDDGPIADAFERYVDAIVAAMPVRAAERSRRPSVRSRAYRLLKMTLFSKYMVAWEWPDGATARHWERVSIPSPTGADLAAAFACAHGPSKGVVVCAHPMRKSAKGYFLASGRAEMLRRNGYDVLLFDFNGFGESPHGDFHYPLDVLAAGAFARRIAGGLPVHALGASFGAGWILCAATREHPFDAIVVESPFTTPQEFYARYPLGKFVLDALWRAFPRTPTTMLPLEAAERLTGDPRVLFIGCLADAKTAPAMTRRIYDRCNVRRERRSIWFANRADHIRAFETDPGEYERRVVAMLDGTHGVAPVDVEDDDLRRPLECIPAERDRSIVA
jgi:pimeloyl-ACP methyl ester carboxylesterase